MTFELRTLRPSHETQICLGIYGRCQVIARLPSQFLRPAPAWQQVLYESANENRGFKLGLYLWHAFQDMNYHTGIFLLSTTDPVHWSTAREVLRDMHVVVLAPRVRVSPMHGYSRPGRKRQQSSVMVMVASFACNCRLETHCFVPQYASMEVDKS